MSFLETRCLTKKFKQLTAVDNFSFQVHKGEVVGILGPNGCGKTTLVSMLITLLKPTSGKVIINNIDLDKKPNDIRKIIGAVFQETVLDENLSAYDNLDIHGLVYKIPGRERVRRIKRLF